MTEFFWDFPGSPVVETLSFQNRDTVSIPSQGTRMPPATWWQREVGENKTKQNSSIAIPIPRKEGESESEWRQMV